MVDEYTRPCLVIYPARSIPSQQVLDMLEDLIEVWGAPAFIRSDNGSKRFHNRLSVIIRQATWTKA